MSRATEKALADLHGVLALHMMERLRAGDCTASDLNVIRQFLKDNGIDCIGAADETLQGIAAELPQFDD